jgi:hypothetical protein
LSFERDREAAFGAVIKRFGGLIGGGVAYGIWLEDIWRGLIWSVWGRRGDPSIPSKVGISPPKQADSPWPSWSWYSSPKPVSWIHSSKVWKSASPASLLPQGSNSPVLVSYTAADELVISAVLREVEMEISKGSSGGGAYILHKGERYGTLDLDSKLDSDESQDANTAPPPQRPSVWLLQLRNKHQIFDDKGGSTMCWAAGLVLEPVVGGGGEYRRRGVFGVYDRGKCEGLFEGRERTRVTLV